MKPTVKSPRRSLRRPTPGAAHHAPFPNALPHGLASGHVLQPGDNVAAFRHLRRRLFHLHQPRTIAEARYVESLAMNTWRVARCRMEQQFFKVHLGAAMSGHPDTAGSLGSPDLHRLHHRGTDCRREERSLEISMSEAEAALSKMQRERTENFTAGKAAMLEDYTVFLAEGEPVVEEEAGVAAEATAPQGADAGDAGESPDNPDAQLHASDSADRGNSEILKRKATTPAPRSARAWSLRRRRKIARQGEAAERRAAPG